MNGTLLINLSWALPFIIFPICYAIFYVYHMQYEDRDLGVRQFATLSMAGTYEPETLLFTFCLHTLAFVGAGLFWAVYVWTNERLAQKQHMTRAGSSTEAAELEQDANGCCMCCGCCFNFEGWNNATFVLGMIASILLFCVGSVSLAIHVSLHGVLAFFMFLAGILHIWVHTSKFRHLLGKRGRILQCLAVAIVVGLNIFCAVLAGIVRYSCDSYRCRSFVVNVLVGLELSTVFGLLLYFESYREEFRSINMALKWKWDAHSERNIDMSINTDEGSQSHREEHDGYEGGPIRVYEHDEEVALDEELK
jgi:hypothetical protein